MQRKEGHLSKALLATNLELDLWSTSMWFTLNLKQVVQYIGASFLAVIPESLMLWAQASLKLELQLPCKRS